MDFDHNHYIGEMSPRAVQVVNGIVAVLPLPKTVWEPFSGETSNRLDEFVDDGTNLIHSSVDDYGEWCHKHDVCEKPWGEKVGAAVVHPPYFFSRCGKTGLGYVEDEKEYACLIQKAMRNIVESVVPGGPVAVVARKIVMQGKPYDLRMLFCGALRDTGKVEFIKSLAAEPDTCFLYMRV